MLESSEFEVASSTGSYGVRIGSGNSGDRVVHAGSIAVIDRNVLSLYPSLSDAARCVVVDAVESSKTLATVAEVIERLRELGATRKTHVVAIGGGIVQDVATLAASLYMRGVTWTYCPTTLLSMVDSCIGGKSSINVGKFKNIAGNFYPPRTVLIDTDFCRTLTPAQMVEGLCEAVKICFADDRGAFDEYLALSGRGNLASDADLLVPAIALSLKTKKRFIEEDEFDQGIRLLLNFGHTFGHAIESATEFRISHGIAVGLGMLAALDLSLRKGWIAPGQPRAARLEAHVRELLERAPDTASPLAAMRPADAFKSFQSDKKHSGENFAVIAYNARGHLERREIPKAENAPLILQIFENLKNVLQ